MNLAWQHELTLHSCAVLPWVLSSVSTYWWLEVFSVWRPAGFLLLDDISYKSSCTAWPWHMGHTWKLCIWVYWCILCWICEFMVWTLKGPGDPGWSGSSCVCLDPQLLLGPDIFISARYLWQQCIYKVPPWSKWRTCCMAWCSADNYCLSVPNRNIWMVSFHLYCICVVCWLWKGWYSQTCVWANYSVWCVALCACMTFLYNVFCAV